MATLERLRLVSFDADDSIAKGGTVRFAGVLLRDVLGLAGVTDYRQLVTLALNDYEVVIPRSDVDAYPVLVATTADGSRMEVERYGPLRVVYPNLGVSFPRSTYDQRWIWQLVSIEVR
jgi:hypothetical protein